MSASLSGKVAVVTGAARGLGREIAQVLAESGADTVVGDIQEEPARWQPRSWRNLAGGACTSGPTSPKSLIAGV